MIKKIVTYKIKEKEFSDFSQIEDYIDNLLGDFIDKKLCNSGIFSPKHRLPIFNNLKIHKKELQEIFNYFTDFEDCKKLED